MRNYGLPSLHCPPQPPVTHISSFFSFLFARRHCYTYVRYSCSVFLSWLWVVHGANIFQLKLYLWKDTSKPLCLFPRQTPLPPFTKECLRHRTTCLWLLESTIGERSILSPVSQQNPIHSRSTYLSFSLIINTVGWVGYTFSVAFCLKTGMEREELMMTQQNESLAALTDFSDWWQGYFQRKDPS